MHGRRKAKGEPRMARIKTKEKAEMMRSPLESVAGIILFVRFMFFIRAPALPSVLHQELKSRLARMAKPGHG